MRLLLRIVLLLYFFTASGCYLYQNKLAEGIIDFHRQNYHDAFVRLLPLARRGLPDAQYAVGYMYYYGVGVTENRKLAWIWINKAANKKQLQAMKARDILTKVHVIRETTLGRPKRE